MCNNITTKKCSKCNIEKPLDDFYKRGNGHAGFCKECYKLKAKIWSQNNKEKRREICKRYVQNNPEKSKESYKLNSIKSKDKRAEWRKNNVVNYLRKRRNNDEFYAFKIRTRNLIRKAFDRNGFTKRSKTNDILGCSYEEFKVHLEKQFLPNMTWDNRSEWHIDHIVPLASAVTEDDVIRLNHFTNLRPLWAKDNLAKGGKVETLL